MTSASMVFAALVLGGQAQAAPYVAYVGNVTVHSASPEAKVMVADLAGGPPVNVSAGLHSARSPAWSPDAAKLAFQAVEEGLADVFVCKPDGTDRANVTATPDEWEASPCFVDSDRLAYLAGPDRAQVMLVDLWTGERRVLLGEPRYYGRMVASPDGSLVAVAGSDKLAGPGHLYLIRTDGSGATQLTPTSAIWSAPCFSPDGQSLLVAYDGWPGGGVSRGLAVIPVGGGQIERLPCSAYPLAPVAWAATGDRIAYTTASCYHTTWVQVAPIGGNGENLRVSPFHIISWPSFSPDGKLLAYQGVYASIYTVNVVDLETGENRRLTPPGETGVNPVFSPR